MIEEVQRQTIQDPVIYKPALLSQRELTVKKRNKQADRTFRIEIRQRAGQR